MITNTFSLRKKFVPYARKVFAKRKVFAIMGGYPERELSLARLLALVPRLRRAGIARTPTRELAGRAESRSVSGRAGLRLGARYLPAGVSSPLM
jgi:hypothetical protein